MIACRVPIDQGDVDRLDLRAHPVRIRDAVRLLLDRADPEEAAAYLDAPAAQRCLKVELGAELDQAVRRFAGRRVGLTRAAVVRAAVAAYGPGARLPVEHSMVKVRGPLLHHIGLRVDAGLYAALQADAVARHGGSVVVAARHHLEAALLPSTTVGGHDGEG